MKQTVFISIFDLCDKKFYNFIYSNKSHLNKAQIYSLKLIQRQVEMSQVALFSLNEGQLFCEMTHSIDTAQHYVQINVQNMRVELEALY